jgi:Helix-turn-helix.
MHEIKCELARHPQHAVLHDVRMTSEADTLRRWIERILAAHGLSAGAAAKKAELAPTTLTRFLNGQTTALPSTTTILKLSKTFNAVPPALGGNGGSGGEFQAPVATPQMRHYVAESELVSYQPQKGQADADTQLLAVLAPGRRNAHVFELHSRALDQLGYLPGDLVIVDLGATPEAGAVVCAQIYEWQQVRADTVMRVYEPPYLVGHSSDPRYRRPEFVDNRRVVIKGVVIASARLSAAA